jgi:hypothetical protein
MFTEDLADPGARRVVRADESGPRAVGLPGERDVPAAALHGLDDEAEAAPGVEPSVEHGHLGRLVAELEEGDGGNEDSPASIKAHSMT